ncbi:MAG: RluA family pseudouridine synthase [Clostridiales bacterium]|nr:RluA family pseudouridine synthase [Clostridiales bacterium]
MMVETFRLPQDMAESRLFPAVCRMLPQVPRHAIREAFDRRDVKMNGERVRRDAQALPGAEIKVYLSGDRAMRLPDILYEDGRIMVVNKPAGMSCEPDGKGGLTVGEWIARSHTPPLPRAPVPCHRLDNPTDGLLLLALNEDVRREMEEAFRQRRVHKKYVCLVRGEPRPAHAVLDAYLRKDAACASVRVTDTPAAGAVSIRTEYTVLAGGPVSRLEITLHTGRTHQIRAQMAHLGHPLLGDDKYGDRAWNREQHAKRLMLTATELTFSLEGPLDYLNGLRFTVQPGF